MKVINPLFITIEGGEGSGKSTHSLLLQKYLQNKGFDVILTREPGGTKTGESIRDILLNPKIQLTHLSELFLYEAARAQLINELIIPALESGKVVICDRFTDATIAYQGFARKMDMDLIDLLNTKSTLNIEPSLTIYLDINPKDGLTRAKKLNKEDYGQSGDRIERESALFHKLVRRGYLTLARRYPQRIKRIRTQDSVEETQKLIIKVVDGALDVRKYHRSAKS
jgi:dTMP kinase